MHFHASASKIDASTTKIRNGKTVKNAGKKGFSFDKKQCIFCR
jgi:hypothetical protein